MVTICSSVNRLFFMTSFSPLEAILSSFNWSENSRAGHVIVTTTRRVRALEVRTGEHNGRRQIFLQAFWQGDDDLMHPSGPRMWLPAESADEIIAALIQANNELKAEGSRA
ncbi:hypothetical protein ACU7M1_09275 [Burkholderia pseudomallei]|uniref:hypothetical protein n=1 Tax=Burkholderia pseudomallei TaxID=28450 RepID=UPI00406C8E00